MYEQEKRNIPSPAPTSRRLEEPTRPVEAADLFHCVADELEMVEQRLSRSIHSSEDTLTHIASYLIHSGGKRIRPLVAFLAFKACGGTRTEDMVDISVALELIHTATLLHDDIIDGAEVRRGKESAYKKFGLKSTLVAGDFLFIKAFEFAGKFDETVVQWTADACTHLTEGEILQNAFNRNRKVGFKDYLKIIKRKTASLFQTGAQLGAYIAGADGESIQLMKQYGLNLGMAFQMIDDVLDVIGHKERLGKPVGMDLRDGNPSLPIVLSVKEGNDTVLDAFECPNPSEASIQRAIDSMSRGKAILQAKTFSRGYAMEATKAIEFFRPSHYRDGLESLARLIVERDF